MPTVQSTILRDEVQVVDGKPFRRVIVYELTAPMPVDAPGQLLFAVVAGFTILMVSVKTTVQVPTDSTYGLYDSSDGELIAYVPIRPHVNGLRPKDIPDLPADLRGPSTVFIRHEIGPVLSTGALVFQITVTGPPSTLPGGLIDTNGDGIPDDTGVSVVGGPLEVYDDFLYGYNKGFQGIILT